MMRLPLFAPMLVVAWMFLATVACAEKFCETVDDGFLYDPASADLLQTGDANMFKGEF